MQSLEWTTTSVLLIVFVSALLCAALGYFFARTQQAKHNAELSAQLRQVQQALDTAQMHYQEQQDKLEQQAENLHTQALTTSQLQAQLANAQTTEQRLDSALDEHKKQLDAAQQTLNTVREQHHNAEKQLEAIQADKRALLDQAQDLRDRLAKAEASLEKERQEISQLKESLAQEGKKAKELETSGLDAREQLSEAKQALNQQQEHFTALQQDHQTLSNEYTELKTTLERKEEHFKEQMQQLSETKQSLTKEFENLANKIFEEKGKTFTQTSQHGIDSLLKPFRDQIDGFQRRINEVHDASLQGQSTLNAEIRKVLEIGMQMSQEATNLTSALKGDSQQRGAWGEAQLRRTLEMSGLVEEAHFEVQSSLKDAEGKQKQTDYLIKLPDNKHIIIDSKVSLVAYDHAISAKTDEEYQAAMGKHIQAVRRHIDDLASKDYTNLVGMRSPSFVLMFMPIEPAYIEALKNNKDLFEYGYRKNVVLVSHTTLIPILRTVANLWMMERSHTEAREISEKAGEIYNQVCLVAERLQKLGGTLNTASNHYNETVKALAGKQGLYGKVDRFNKLSSKVTKTLPAIEPGHRDFEADRLSLIVEVLEEPAVIE